MHVKAKKERIDDVIAKYGAAEPYLVPIFRAIRDYGLGLLLVQQGMVKSFWPRREKGAKNRPILALLSDDLAESLGPSAFHLPSLRKLFRDARSAVVVAGEQHPILYATAVTDATFFSGCVVLIECRPETQDEWIAFAQKHGCNRILAGCVRGQPPTGTADATCLGDLPQWGRVNETIQ